MTHGVTPCQTCGDHDESPDPISGFRWRVEAHRVEPEPGQAKPAGERDATETCRPAAGRRHKRASPERSSTASRAAGGVLRGTSAGGAARSVKMPGYLTQKTPLNSGLAGSKTAEWGSRH